MEPAPVMSMVHAGMHARVERLPGECVEDAFARLWATLRLAVSAEGVGMPPEAQRSAGIAHTWK